MTAQNSGRIDEILAQSQALRGRLAQRFNVQDQVLQNIQNAPPPTNFMGDFATELVDQASFNVLDRPSGGGVGSTIGRAGGGLLNAATMVGLLGLTPFAPEVTVPTALALSGLLGGGSMEARTQYNQSGRITDPGAIVTQGGIEGALNLIPGSKAASLGRRLLTDVPVQAVAGVVGDAGSQMVRGQPYNPGETLQAGAMGSGMGVLSALLGGPRSQTPPPLPEPVPVHQLPGQHVAGLLPAPAAMDHGFTGTPANPPLLPGAPKLLTGGVSDPMAQAELLLTGKETPLLTGRRVVTTADGRSTFEVESTPPPGGDGGVRLGGDSGVMLRRGAQDIADAEFKAAEPDGTSGPVHEGEIVDAEPTGLRTTEQGYVDPASINSPVQQTFKNRSSAMRGARNLGLATAQVQPVQTGPGQWMIHKTDPPLPAPVNTAPVTPESVTPQPADLPAAPVETVPPQVVAPPVADAVAPVVPVVPAQAPVATTKPQSVVNALRGLDPRDSATVHDFDLSAVQPGQKVEGLGVFKGVDEDGLPIISRRGGGKRPGESGVAYDGASLPTLLKQAGDVLAPDDTAMIQQILQDVQTGQATRFVGRAKVGRSSELAASVDNAATSAAYGASSFDRVLSVEFKPATLTPKGELKTPAQVRANVIDSSGHPATRIIREAGNPDVGYIRSGADRPLDAHSPVLLDPTKRDLVTDTQVAKAGAVRRAAQGTKHANNPIVQRLDDAIRSNDPKQLQQAIRDIDRLPPEIQKQLGIDAGCIK